MILDDNSNYSFEDPAMTQSGITLSGANVALSGKEVPLGREDGVLTALEISLVRLDNCDLVVLSACETGLGKVGSEGVFGLQRGFKKAGAKSILMSLWDVNDEATSLLMNKFYEEYIRTGDKQRSLYNAQQYIRHYSERYSNPEFWAGWVLLDAIYLINNIDIMSSINFPITRIDGSLFEVSFNTNIYDKEAINATAYRYSGTFYVHQILKDDNIVVTFETKDKSEVSESMVKQFCTDVVDQQLRIDINNRVGHIRDLIVEEAFKPVNK